MLITRGSSKCTFTVISQNTPPPIPTSLTSTQLGWQLAALVVATAPVMIVYFIFQKRLAEGVVGGAIKG